jgi:hypothetical protein
MITSFTNQLVKEDIHGGRPVQALAQTACRRRNGSRRAVAAAPGNAGLTCRPRLASTDRREWPPTWRRRRDNMWHFYNASPAKPHYAALRKTLNAHADRLARKIDNGQEPSGCRPELKHQARITEPQDRYRPPSPSPVGQAERRTPGLPQPGLR